MHNQLISYRHEIFDVLITLHTRDGVRHALDRAKKKKRYSIRVSHIDHRYTYILCKGSKERAEQTLCAAAEPRGRIREQSWVQDLRIAAAMPVQ